VVGEQRERVASVQELHGTALVVLDAMAAELARLRRAVDGDEPPPGSSRPPLRLVGSTLERPARRERGDGAA
jgi:hypothetical protein